MVDRDRVDQLFAMLARYLRILRDLADMPLVEYQDDPRNFGSGERFLQLAIETVLSVGHHIIASAGFDQPATYAEVFRVLGKEGVLNAEFAAMLEPMARMRNRLVHHYEDIEPARVHETLRTRLGDFDLFAQSITEYLDRSGRAD
ncbi:MAG: type VII toxin-antitoxin system HepT family RNase toxin [Pseudonocardiaceae bacterium]